jgi:N-acetylmuramoyl-L-alanine amidase
MTDRSPFWYDRSAPQTRAGPVAAEATTAEPRSLIGGAEEFPLLTAATTRYRKPVMRTRWRAAILGLVILATLAAGDLAAAAAGSAAGATPASCARSAFRVVLDVGHTADVPGAMSARGVPEYAFNLKLAEAMQQALVAAGFANTVRLVTATAPWRGLFERAAHANAMHADLLIAIHHDSVPDELIETWQYDGRENQFSDRFRGYAIFVSNNHPDRAGSLAFGHALGKELEARGLNYTPHYTLPLMGRHRHQLIDAEAGVYRYDQLVVLKQTRMPAVLLEAGSIVNRQEELELATPERRQLIAAAVAAAVEDFCTMRARALPVKPTPPRRDRHPAAAGH